MNDGASQRPPGFESLSAFAGRWSASTVAERDRIRGERSDAERRAFNEAAKRVLPRALHYLDRKPLSTFDGQETRLMVVMLNLAHVSLTVELQGEAEAKHSTLRALSPMTRASADDVAR
jgi:hypothetical protein